MIDNGRYIPSSGVRIALLAGAAILGWISIRSAAQNGIGGAAPQLAAQFWPADGPSLAAQARQRVALASGEVDEPSRALFRAALAREPLLSDPLALAALDAAKGDPARAERLMVAARNRDPRAPLPRFFLFDHYVRRSDYARALAEVGPAIRLQPDASTALLTVLSLIANTPEGRTALARKLATHPFWRAGFFKTASTNTQPETMLALLSALPTDASRDAGEEQRAVYFALINSGAGARAYATWRGLLPAAYRDRIDGVYDGSFGGWPGAQPFNWTLGDGSIGTARMVRAADLPQSTALDVRYFGSTGGTLAEQYVSVRPGAYQLQLSARRRTTGATGGRLSMELRCVNGDVIATLPIEPLDPQLRTLTLPVTVPAGCDMARLRLIGTPGDLFSEVEAQVTGVALVRAN
ncbi:tetratricopeptide repeat protein [Sphingomonas jatrophae]|uniref:Tetratricopeptide repeat-containing protein n=1 Tax=Sphingomonas jatrophae TaxID=1166337 RepID=A0A1I6L601_9SPHN|nr:hypothetical protein [Sphingomonas jatrophae]SFR98889.1 hypothetical protein SAMN05192580_2344 [Sphingomonas jatrophae]